MSDDERQIREVVELWMAATKAGDIQTILSLMTDDVLFIVADRKPFGKEEFRRNSEEHAAKALEFDGKSDIREIKVFGEYAYMINKLDIAMRPAGGEQTNLSGYTLTIFRKENGKWLLARDANLVTPDKH
jgi:uncharacterized protein (TIGR02246 family)